MAKYFKQALLFEGYPANPAIETLTALKPMKRSYAEAVMRAQDKLAATSQRIVCRFGMQGSVAWRVKNSDPDGTSGQVYPDSSTEFLCARSLAELTPGCMYRLYVLCVPAGPTQYDTGAGGPPTLWDNDGTGGEVRAEVDWYDAASGSESTQHSISLPPSTLQFGAENTDAGGLFTSMRLLRTNYITPPNIGDVDETARFSRHITADIRLKVVGGARVIDAWLVEEKFAVAFEADDASNLWTSHVFGQPKPDTAGGSMPYPLQRGSETTPDGNPRQGTWHTMDVAAAQQLRLGPALMQATAFSETDSTATSTLDAWSIGNAWTRIPDQVATNTYDSTAAGWSVGCGGYALSWDHGNDYVLRGRTAVIPVYCRVYGSMSGATDTGTVRFQTAQHSYVDVSISGTTDGWADAYGWLQVSVTPEQPVVLQVFATGGSTDTLDFDSIAVHYGGQWVPRA